MNKSLTARRRKQVQEKIPAIARGQLGKPYVYGAYWQDAPRIFDCSSFVQWVYKQVGIAIPRVSIEQATHGKRVPAALDRLKIGDLIFLRSTSGRYNPRFPTGIGHVVIVTGPNEYVHASSRRMRGQPGQVRIGKLTTLLKGNDVTVVKRLL